MNITEKSVTPELHVFSCETSQLDYLIAHPCARLVGLVRVQADRPQVRYALIYHYASAVARNAAQAVAEREERVARKKYNRNCRHDRVNYRTQLQDLV